MSDADETMEPIGKHRRGLNKKIYQAAGNTSIKEVGIDGTIITTAFRQRA
jgi:hypothetical protein